MQHTLSAEELVKPIRNPCYEVEQSWRFIPKTLQELKRDYGGMELNPDYQRGHVWGPDQQQAFIENVMRGVVSSAGRVIQFNCRNWNASAPDSDLPAGFQCIDGLQRLTAVQEYLAGNVAPFGRVVGEWEGTSWDIRRLSFRLTFAVFDFQYRAEVLAHYLAHNAGGTPHSPEELDRVRALLTAAEAH